MAALAAASCRAAPRVASAARPPLALQRGALTGAFCTGGLPAARWLQRGAVAAGGGRQRRRRAAPPPQAASWFQAGIDHKEERLKRFRVVYTFADWKAHRSVTRYWRHFSGLFSSRIVAGISLPLLLVFLEATAVCVYEHALKGGLLPAGFPTIQVRAPMLFSLSSFALSLLLVFRTNQSYARFDEARRLWGMMINRCRDMMRQMASYLGPQQPELMSSLARWVKAYPWVLKNHVREHKRYQEDLKRYLQPEELEAVVQSSIPPLMALQVISELLDRANISAKQRLQADKCVSDLSDGIGSCERILRTPIPPSYTRHLCRFLVIWLCLLPFSIHNQCGWVTILSSVILGFFLLAIEEIGVIIEEPFNILPLEKINRWGNVTLPVKQQPLASALAQAACGLERPEHHLAGAMGPQE